MYTTDEINGERFLLELCSHAEKSCALKADNLRSLKGWQRRSKAAVLKALGCGCFEADEREAEIVESAEIEDGSIRRDKYILPTAKNLKMPLYVLIPKECNGRVMLALHGHGSYGKEGIAGNLPKQIAPREIHSAYGLEMAKRGFITLCPDLFGSGERMTWLCGDYAKSVCDMLNSPLIALGSSLQGVAVFELTRLLSFGLSLKENKYDKAFVCGFSGGGLFSLLMAALSEDIEAAVVSGYFHPQRETCLQSNKCGCNFVYNMWNIADCGELAAMAAPKPLFIEVGDGDKLHGRRGLEGVYSQREIAAKAYRLYNKEERLELSVCKGAHKWYGSCCDFLERAQRK